MQLLRGIGGVLLLILAAMKGVGIVTLLVQGTADHSTAWFVKQCVYAVAALAIGVTLLTSSRNENEEADQTTATDEKTE